MRCCFTSLNKKLALSTFLTLLCLCLSTCASRYRLDLFVVNEEGRSKVKVTNTQYYPGSELGDAMTEAKIIGGDGSVAVITVGLRGKEIVGSDKYGLGLDEYNKYRIFIEFDDIPKPAMIELAGNSFIQLMEHYDLSIPDKIYKPVTGVCIIDSLHGNKVFCSLNGVYDNHKGEEINIDGRFKFKISL